MKCFEVDANRIEGRLNPNFYDSGVIKLREDLSKRFGEHCFKEVIEDIYRYPTFYGFQYQASGIPVIKGESINEDGIIEHNQHFDYITPEIHKRFSRTQLRKGDLVFTVRGIIGKVGFFDGFAPEANINANLIKIRINKEHNPKFFWIFLNSEVGQRLIQILTSGQVQKTITVSDIKNVNIPLPSLQTQNNMAELVESTYILKRRKDEEAKRLLDSINGFVFRALGIEIDTNRNRIFAIGFESIKKRLNPLYYAQDIFSFLNNFIGKMIKLGEGIQYAKAGFPAGYAIQDLEQKGVIQIRPTNIGDNGQLLFDKNVHVKNIHISKKKGDLLAKGEVLFNNTNSQELVGKSAFFNLDGKYFCSNHVTRIKVNEHVLNSEYLTLILNIYQENKVFFKLCTNWNNQSGVNVELLKTVIIPLPSLEVQGQIANEVHSRISKAKQLQKETREELERAKAEVEKIILGE